MPLTIYAWVAQQPAWVLAYTAAWAPGSLQGSVGTSCKRHDPSLQKEEPMSGAPNACVARLL